jgi:carbon storage regulator
MLVLSRSKNESIIINDNIRVSVLEVKGDRVRLGIEAPKEIPVHRYEVQQAILKKQENSNGGTTGNSDSKNGGEG